MAFVQPVTLADRGLHLVPLELAHEDGLRAAAADGELWKLRITSVPEPENTAKYIDDALRMRADGNRFLESVRKTLRHAEGTYGIVAMCLERPGELVAVVGRVGAEVSLEQGRLAAKICTMRALAVLTQQLGDLEGVERVLRINVYVRSAHGWRMVAHHASPGLPADLPDISAEPRNMLH